MRYLISITLVFIAISIVAWRTHGSPLQKKELDPAQVLDKQLKPVMKRKLANAKALLEGLAKEDYEAISRNAQALSLLSLESGWNVLVTEEYLKQSNSFRRSLESVRDGAKSKNLDRAALGYVDMTIRCIECHKYARQNQGVIQQRAIN